jgi:hypothetical protein
MVISLWHVSTRAPAALLSFVVRVKAPTEHALTCNLNSTSRVEPTVKLTGSETLWFTAPLCGVMVSAVYAALPAGSLAGLQVIEPTACVHASIALEPF